MGCGASVPVTEGDGAPVPPRVIPFANKFTVVQPESAAPSREEVVIPGLQSFPYEVLARAASNFSESAVISEGGLGAPNVVFKGQLASGKYVAIKSFPRRDWEDENAFIEQARRVSTQKDVGLVPLIGFCCNERTRMLVADFMPNATLARHLFHWDKAPMAWQDRLTVAVKVAETLASMATSPEGLLYHDLNSYRVLFHKKDQRMLPSLSCFGLVKVVGAEGSYSSDLTNLPPEYFATGTTTVTPESTVYSFGMLLQAIVGGRSIRPNQFLELIENPDAASMVVDSSLLEGPGREACLQLLPLIATCLKPNPGERPTLQTVLSFLSVVASRTQNEGEVARGGSGHLSDPLSSSPQLRVGEIHLSPFGKAAKAGDLKSLHDMLSAQPQGTPPQEPSFESWNPDQLEMISARKKGDAMFKTRKWEEAIALYTKYRKLNAEKEKEPLMVARRCLCYMFLNQFESALSDAMTTQFENPDWPEAYFLQSVALRKLNLVEDAAERLASGATIDQQMLAKFGNGEFKSRSPSPISPSKSK